MCSLARAQRVEQVWTQTFPPSPPAGMWDAPVGVGVSVGDRVFMGGTRTASANPTTSRFAVAKYDFSGNLLASVQWPKFFVQGAPADYTARAMAVHDSIGYTVIVITGTHHRTDGSVECVTVAYQNDNTTDQLTLAGTASLTFDWHPDVTPVAITFSPDGLGVGIVCQVYDGTNSTIAAATYSSSDLQGANVWTYSPTNNDTPVGIALTDSKLIIAGTSPHPGDPSRRDMLMMTFPSQQPGGNPSWVGRSKPGIGESDEARAMALAVDGFTGEPYSGALYYVVGSRVNSSGHTDHMTVAFDGQPCTGDCQPKWEARAGDSGTNELATAAVAFHLTVPDGELPGGDYVYVTGIADAALGTGYDTYTKLYRDTGGMLPQDRWPLAARWNNLPVSGDDEAPTITLTSTDDTGDSTQTRAIVQGWTTDASGNPKFVAIKYDAADKSNPPVPQFPKWAKIQDSPTTGQQNGYAIVHKMITENGQPYLNYFSVGSTNDGASATDFRIFRFKEFCETGSCP